MYISPDASPADGLIRSKIKGAGSRPSEEDTDASTVTVQDATASADETGDTSTALVSTVLSLHNDVKFSADADSQLQDTSLPTGTINDANDVESSSKERVKDSNTHDFTAIRVDGDLDPALLLKEGRREEHLEDTSMEARVVPGTGTATISASGDDVDLQADKMLPLPSPHKFVESPSYSHQAASAIIRYSSQNFKLPFQSSGTVTRTGTGAGAGTGRGVLTSSGNMFHSLMFTGMGGTGTNTEDASVSVCDMDMGNISYDTMSFAADRMMMLGQSSLLDLNNTEDLLKDIFRDEEKDDDDDDDDEDDGVAERAVMKWNADPGSVLPGPQDDHGSAKKISDTDTDSSTDDFDGIFRLP